MCLVVWQIFRRQPVPSSLSARCVRVSVSYPGGGAGIFGGATVDHYPDSDHDYAHNRPQVVIAYGCLAVVMWGLFFVVMFVGWLVL